MDLDHDGNISIDEFMETCSKVSQIIVLVQFLRKCD